MTKELFIRKTTAVGTFVIALVAFAVVATPAKAEDAFEQMSIEAQTTQLREEMVAYYPIVETPEWDAMDYTEKIAACQYSEEQMASMSTEELVRSVLASPFMAEMYFFDTTMVGFQHLSSEFPVIQRILEREDFLDVVPPMYEKMLATKGIDGGKNIMNIPFLQILCTQVEAVNDWVAAASVKTPVGSAVAVVDNSGFADFTASEKASLNSKTDSLFANAIRIGDPSRRYNCHSYAWPSPLASNPY